MTPRVDAEQPHVEVLLPMSEDALFAAESQVDVFLEQLGIGRDDTLAYSLRLIVNEGFRNAIKIQPVEGRLRLIRLALRTHPQGVCVSLLEPGNGFLLKGHHPPYPEDWIGQTFHYSKILNQDLNVRVETSTRLVFQVKRDPEDTADDRATLLEQAQGSGMGLLSLCHACDEVVMEYDPIDGNTLKALYRLHPEDFTVHPLRRID
jgi:anti-sigma regulatory factor (Ser/Thr protein kinase)